jgi:MFS family permease
VIEVVAGFMPTFETTAALLVPAGLAMLTFTTAANAAVQLGVEPTMRGRVMALYLMCFMGGTPIGAPIIGWVSGAFGPRWGMVGGGLICLVAAVSLLATRSWSMRRRWRERSTAIAMRQLEAAHQA